MIEVNEVTLTIDITESLWYEYHVKPVLDEIKEETQGFFDEPKEVLGDEFAKEDLEEFLHYELTTADKIDLLNAIVGKYETYSNYDNSVSIFDEGLIRSCVCEWIEEKFGFKWE